MAKFKVGDIVKIINNTSDSINQIGDIGIINIILNFFGEYRVYVKNREYDGKGNIGNWYHEDSLVLVVDDSPQMVKDLDYFKENAEEDYITTPISVLRYISELEKALKIQKIIKKT